MENIKFDRQDIGAFMFWPVIGFALIGLELAQNDLFGPIFCLLCMISIFTAFILIFKK